MSRIHKDLLYRELRCRYCRNLIGWEYVNRGRFLYDCPRCLKTTTFDFRGIKDIRKDVRKEVKKQNNG